MKKNTPNKDLAMSQPFIYKYSAKMKKFQIFEYIFHWYIKIFVIPKHLTIFKEKYLVFSKIHHNFATVIEKQK